LCQQSPHPARKTQFHLLCPRYISSLISSNINPENVLPYTRRPLALITSDTSTPRTFNGALSSPDKDLWLASIKRELESMNALGVWEVIELDPLLKLVGTTWVFKIKKDHLGQVTEYKARLCAQGFTQSAGIDFNQTYAPTGRLNSLRTLIAFAAAKNLDFHQIDIKSAFLNAPLSETVYLGITQGLDIDKRSHCLRLRKAIYGLKQAPLAWYDRLKTWLVAVGFSSCISDPCVFLRKGEYPVWLYIHVDDIAIFGRKVQYFKEEVMKEFEIKDVGPADLMLGIKVTHSAHYVSLDQQHFTESLLELYGMINCNSVSTPLVPNEHLSSASISESTDFGRLKVNFRSAVGSINYLSTATRPDLSFADLGLTYPRGINVGILAYSNADWGNCRVSRRSVTGFLATVGGSLVLWKTRKQPSVLLSTAEAEYKALCDLTSELLWLGKWCRECNIIKLDNPIPVHEDNQSCINVVKGDCNLNNKRMKHVDIQLHFIKEAISNNFIELRYTPTANMLAYFLTKSVNRSILTCALNSLGVLRLDHCA
ncbi:hypothetical protein O181_100142, partial [Austropuccinia psidii MF-1]|nr:hypothetical protein [Austropuccinia psidii MF-1]